MLSAKIVPLFNAMQTWRMENGLAHSGKIMNFGKSVVTNFNSTEDNGLADTGAMTCSVSEETCRSMNVTPEMYLPTEMKIVGASGKFLRIKGCILAKVWTPTSSTN